MFYRLSGKKTPFGLFDLTPQIPHRLPNDGEKHVRDVGKLPHPVDARDCVHYLERSQQLLVSGSHLWQSLDRTNVPSGGRLVSVAIGAVFPSWRRMPNTLPASAAITTTQLGGCE